jgi:hypothetical protein
LGEKGVGEVGLISEPLVGVRERRRPGADADAPSISIGWLGAATNVGCGPARASAAERREVAAAGEGVVGVVGVAGAAAV